MNSNDMNKEEVLNCFNTLLKDTDEFALNEFGEFCISEKGEKKVVANFSVIPTKQVMKLSDNGAPRPYKFEMTGFINQGGIKEKLTSFEVLYNEFSNDKWISKNIPFGIFNLPRKTAYMHLQRFILTTLDSSKGLIEYDNPGWHYYDSQWFYLHSAGVFGPLNNVYTTDKNSLIEIDENLSRKEAFVTTLKMLSFVEGKLTHALLGFLLTSLITTPLMKSKVSPNFSLWIYGQSGTGKTSIAKLFTQIFYHAKIVHVYDMKKDIQSNIGAKDSVAIYDDYGTAKTTQSSYRMDEKVEEIIRAIGDREVSTNFSFIPEGMAMFTGERFLANQSKNESSSARLVRVKMDNVFNSKLSESYDSSRAIDFKYYSSRTFLPTSIAGYLEWLSTEMNNNFIQKYSDDLESIKSKLSMRAHQRHIDSIAHLINSFNFYLSYGFQKGFITPEQFAEFKNAGEKHFRQLLEEQNKVILNTETEEFLSVLKSVIEDEEMPIKIKDRPYGYYFTTEPMGILDLEKNTLSLSWQIAYDLVSERITSQKERNYEFISNKMLGKALREANMILPGPQGVTKVINGLKARAIQLKTETIPELVESIVSINENSPYLKRLREIEEDYSNYDY
ncbi:energy-coupling factor transporter ATP-binding protein EcfA2 [Paenibacillus sp. JGP012]|uniref:hypothetical protein n=1 Tax=Paenibacillus sp. JGP012 TaxID=2735914 RepID=UPI001613D946|nr:hypothetical protein [Paenibacillus sp. JGP012]MBB6019055.1 energy-coupling factor transporter ATP-binding protein EcfA2 [Paenibacillus sp. JGP012]